MHQLHQCFTSAFFVQNFGAKNYKAVFWVQKKFGAKCAHKMLMKLTKGLMVLLMLKNKCDDSGRKWSSRRRSRVAFSAFAVCVNRGLHRKRNSIKGHQFI